MKFAKSGDLRMKSESKAQSIRELRVNKEGLVRGVGLPLPR